MMNGSWNDSPKESENGRNQKRPQNSCPSNADWFPKWGSWEAFYGWTLNAISLERLRTWNRIFFPCARDENLQFLFPIQSSRNIAVERHRSTVIEFRYSVIARKKAEKISISGWNGRGIRNIRSRPINSRIYRWLRNSLQISWNSMKMWWWREKILWSSSAKTPARVDVGELLSSRKSCWSKTLVRILYRVTIIEVTESRYSSSSKSGGNEETGSQNTIAAKHWIAEFDWR